MMNGPKGVKGVFKADTYGNNPISESVNRVINLSLYSISRAP